MHSRKPSRQAPRTSAVFRRLKNIMTGRQLPAARSSRMSSRRQRIGLAAEWARRMAIRPPPCKPEPLGPPSQPRAGVFGGIARWLITLAAKETRPCRREDCASGSPAPDISGGTTRSRSRPPSGPSWSGSTIPTRSGPRRSGWEAGAPAMGFAPLLAACDALVVAAPAEAASRARRRRAARRAARAGGEADRRHAGPGGRPRGAGGRATAGAAGGSSANASRRRTRMVEGRMASRSTSRPPGSRRSSRAAPTFR